jgi:AcrR family transcriptional regulator
VDDDRRGGRANQRRRTRETLLAAAGALLAQGRSPTVPEVADAAGVSRATAYRYFPSQASLLASAAAQASAAGRIDAELAEIRGLPDAESRAAALIESVRRLVADNETAFRALLRASLDPAGEPDGPIPRRRGTRVRWIEAAIGPPDARLPPNERRRLVAALSLLGGIETSIVLQDVCGLDQEEADAVAAWAARALVRQALGRAD